MTYFPMHGTSKKALSYRGRVGVDGSKFTTFQAVSRILHDDEPANLTHASTHSLHTPVRFEKIGELGRLAADLLQSWVSIKRGFPLFGPLLKHHLEPQQY